MKYARDAFIQACKSYNLEKTKGPFHTYVGYTENLAFYLDHQTMRSGDLWDINIGINRIGFVDERTSTLDSEFIMRFQGLIDHRSLDIDIFLVVKSEDPDFFDYCVEVFQKELILPLKNLNSAADLLAFSKLHPRHMMLKELRSFLANLD